MRVDVQNDRHSAAIGCEYRFPEVPSKSGGGSRVTDADESIKLQPPQPKVEKDSTSILRSQRLDVGTDFRQFKSTIHAAELLRQTHRDTMAPSFRSGRF